MFITLAGLVIIGLILFVAGAVGLLFYMLSRMVGSDGWDDSNITNGLRLVSHTTLHPEDFGLMFYLTPEQLQLLKDNGHDPERPFWYISEDEFEGVVKSRPDFDINEYKS